VANEKKKKSPRNTDIGEIVAGRKRHRLLRVDDALGPETRKPPEPLSVWPQVGNAVFSAANPGGRVALEGIGITTAKTVQRRPWQKGPGCCLQSCPVLVDSDLSRN